MAFSDYDPAWKDERVTTSAERLVLLAIARYANDEHGRAWPSAATIARCTHLSRRWVIKTLASLREKGLISKVGTGPRGTGSYVLSLNSTSERDSLLENSTSERDSPSIVNGVHPNSERGSHEKVKKKELKRRTSARVDLLSWEEMQVHASQRNLTVVKDYVRTNQKDERGRPLWRYDRPKGRRW